MSNPYEVGKAYPHQSVVDAEERAFKHLKESIQRGVVRWVPSDAVAPGSPKKWSKDLGSEIVLIYWNELLGHVGKALVRVEVNSTGMVGRMVLSIPVGYLPASGAEIEMMALSVAKSYLMDKETGIAPGNLHKLSSVDVRASDGLDEEDNPAEWKFEYQVDLGSVEEGIMSYGWELDAKGFSHLRGVRW